MRGLAHALVPLVGLGLAASAAAQAPESRAITLDEALAAVGQAPGHVAAAAHAHAAAEAVASAGGLPPTSLTVGTSRVQAKLIAGVQVPLPVFGRPRVDRAVARAERGAAQAGASQTDLQLRHDVAAAWLELARRQARAALATEQAARAAKLAEVAQRRFEAGDVPRQDAAQARAASARQAAEARGEAARVDAASAELASLLGWDPVTPLRARGGLPSPLPAPPPLAPLIARLPSHPELAAADARVAAAAARVRAASRNRWPAVSVGAETEVFDPTLPGPDVRVTLNLDVPLFGRRIAARDTAVAERAGAAADRAAQGATARGALVAAYRRYGAARTEAQAFARDVVPAAQDAAHLADVGYGAGQTGLVSVLEAQRSLTDAQRQAVDARAAAATALADLEQAAGGAW